MKLVIRRKGITDVKSSKVAISGMGESRWICITGKVVIDGREELKDAMFEAVPAHGNVETREELVVYCLENMDVKLCGFGAQPVTLKD